jgi:hypothetical protein
MVTAVTAETGLAFDSDGSEGRYWIKAEALLNKGIRSEQPEKEIRRLMK